MKKSVAALIGLAFVAAASIPARAATATVTGQLVDTHCYTMDKSNTGVAHKNMSPTCAQDCAKMGAPVALLTAEGKVYEITGELAANKNAKLVPHMSHTVEITGDVTDKDGKMTIAAADLKMIKK